MWDQVLVGAEAGDAITRSALLLGDALARLGPATIHAEHVGEGLEDRVRPLDALASRPNPTRPLIFHTSMGSWPVHRAILAHAPELVVVHHNFSPPESFADIAPQVADDLVRGTWELTQLRDRVVRAVADSDYNAAQLHELGYRDVTVVAPTPDTGRLTATTPDAAMLGRISSWGPGPVVLGVSQLLPHKRTDRLLAAAAVLQAEHHPDATLALVGGERFAPYSRALRAAARTFGPRQPHFLGRITDAELAALYLRADLFVTLSEHEGFCIPVVEAMATGVPVVAAARAAIPATVADAGLLVDDPDDPHLVAEVMAAALADSGLRHLLIGRGMHRARQLSAERTLPRLLAAVTGVDLPVGAPAP